MFRRFELYTRWKLNQQNNLSWFNRLSCYALENHFGTANVDNFSGNDASYFHTADVGLTVLVEVHTKKKIGSVAAHLRGMRPTLTARKATQCLEETQTLTELSI